MAVFVVTSTNDSGSGSLRAAIASANATAARDDIIFDEALAGKTIALQSELVITRDVTINGNIKDDSRPDITILGGVNGNPTFNLDDNGIFLITGGDVVLRSVDLADAVGAIETDADVILTVIDSTIRDSIGRPTGLAETFGAGILAFGKLNVINTTISANTALFGGGVAVGASATFVNSTIHGNTARDPDPLLLNSPSGGGVFLFGGGELSFFNSTITGNRALNGSGGGIGISGSATIQIVNSVFAENVSARGTSNDITDVAPSPVVAFNSFFASTVALNPSSSGNLNGAGDPLLGALAANGGAGLTRLPLLGSRLIDAGSNARLPADAFDIDGDGSTVDVLPLDAAGRTRIFNEGIGIVDIGATEFQHQPPVITSNGGGAAASVEAVENRRAVTTIVATDVTEVAPTFQIIGGPDAALFTIDATTGALTFAALVDVGGAFLLLPPPDFEAPADANGDNVYEVSVAARSGVGLLDVQALTVTMLDLNEAPVKILASSTEAPQGTPVNSLIAELSPDDPDLGDSFTFSLVSNSDGRFALIENRLVLVAPLDAAAKASHEVVVRVVDRQNLAVEQTITIAVVQPQSGPVPEWAKDMAVYGDGYYIAYGDTTPRAIDYTDFGSADSGAEPVERTFVVVNNGDAPLATSELNLPAGFTVVEELSPEIAPGESDSFTVRLETDGEGVADGVISFAGAEGDETPFTFEVTGRVAPDVEEEAAAPVGETHDAAGGAIVVTGAVAELFGDTVAGFGPDDAVRFTSGVAALGDLVIDGNLVRLASGGQESLALTLDGDFSAGRFFFSPEAGGAANLFFQNFLADEVLVDGAAVPEASINGSPHPAALTGDGSRTFTVTLSEQAKADFTNALGVYEIEADGSIVDARILFDDAKAGIGATAAITVVEPGNRLGFFLVEGGLGDEPVMFVDAAGRPANTLDGPDVEIRIGGEARDVDVFHSFSDRLNDDGFAHVRSGADPSGTGIRMAFEDMLDGGDRDFQDVVFRVNVLGADGDVLI